MKKLSCFIFMSLILLLVLSCEGPQGIQGPPGEDGDYDKQITLIFPEATSIGTIQEDGYILTPNTHILKFNKHNYSNVDSIIFTACLRCEAEDNYGFAELYNITDSTIIDSSLVMSNTVSPDLENLEWVETGNIFNYLPDHDITLAVMIRTENQGRSVGIFGARLYLFRD